MTELLVTVSPDTLTLNPGESAQVTVTVDPASSSGTGSASITVEVPPQSDGVIVGAFAGLVPAGEHWHVTGDVNLTGDLIVEGLLTGIDTFRCQGNGFSIFFQNGGRADLHGKPKAPWGPWGCDSTGWAVGDRIAVAPTAVGIYLPSVMTWSGDWASMVRPTNSPDVTQVDGSIAKPEVANLSQTIVFENLVRGLHIHDSGGVMNLSDIKMLNCGTTGVMGSYPVHFHQVGDNSRGSLLERVVVEGGKNHAFVPHGSHGISFPGCVAYNTTGVAFWWDKPIANQNPPHLGNDSDDINWDDTLAIWSKPSTMPEEGVRLAGYWLGAGTNVSCNRAVATCVAGNPTSGSRQRAGFNWPEAASREPWDFRGCVGHNNAENGIFTWQNADKAHFVEDFIGYNNGYSDVNHGAYQNRYRYSRMVLTGSPFSVVAHANTRRNLPSPLLFEDIVTDRPLRVERHNLPATVPAFFRRCSFPSVVYDETDNGSYNRFEDCGLTPADFELAAPAIISPSSVIEIAESGVLLHRWAAGVWT